MRWLILTVLLASTSAFAQNHYPGSWMTCPLREQRGAEERLEKIYNTKIAQLEVEKEMECRITRTSHITGWARCTKEGKAFARVRMDVHFYCDSPKTRLAKTVITYL